MPTKPIVGLHHVTAIASNPQRNLDFYTGVLGLRFVKKTVNFDDPGTYHFYFGDDVGTPGTILTFFPWPHASRGTVGAGEVTHTAFSIPPSSADYWEQRLAATKVPVERTEKRMGETLLTFKDPDGMGIELVGRTEAAELKAPRFSDVPVEHAIRGFFGVTMLQRSLQGTEAALGLLGFRLVAEEGNRSRFSAEGNALGNHLDIVVDPNAGRGRPGAGSVHHIAFRSEDYEDQKKWLANIGQSMSSSPIMERDYFRLIYFREPGGVLFELATDIPGFSIDEPIDTLGETLCVPDWLEPHLAEMTKHLPEVILYKAQKAVLAWGWIRTRVAMCCMPVLRSAMRRLPWCSCMGAAGQPRTSSGWPLSSMCRTLRILRQRLRGTPGTRFPSWHLERRTNRILARLWRRSKPLSARSSRPVSSAIAS